MESKVGVAGPGEVYHFKKSGQANLQWESIALKKKSLKK